MYPMTTPLYNRSSAESRDEIRMRNTHVAEVPEWDKLDDVSDRFLSRVGSERAAVSVQKLHGGEVGVAHPDDNDGHGQLGGLNYSVTCLVHVADHAVSNDQQREILLQKRKEKL